MKRHSIFLLFVLSLSFYQCANKCEDVFCQNGGECVDGNCACPDLTYGENCEFEEPCFGVECFNGGVCAADTCQCPDGFIGVDCGTADPCYNVTCEDFEVCVNGECECPLGYEGVDCSVESRTKFFGTYVSDGTQVCQPSGISNFSNIILEITAAGSVQSIWIDFDQDLADLIAVVDGNEFTLDAQYVNGVQYSGNGSISQDATELALILNTLDANGLECVENHTAVKQ